MLTAAPVQRRTRPRPDAAPERAAPPAVDWRTVQRGAGNALLARWAVQQRGPRAIQRTKPAFGFPERGGMPEQDRAALSEAWDILNELERRPLAAPEVARIAQVAGQAHDPTPLLQKFASSKVGLAVRGIVGRPAQAGETYLSASYGEGEGQLSGNDSGSAFENLMRTFDPLPVEQRAQVKFTVIVTVSTPKPNAFGRREGGYDVGYFLETLIHELAVHAEKYLPALDAYVAGTADLPVPAPVADHRGLLFAPGARLVEYLTRLQAAAAAGERIGGRPAGELLAKVRRELGREPGTMNDNERVPLAPGQQELGWLDQLLGPGQQDAAPPVPLQAAPPQPGKKLSGCCVLI